MLARVGSAILVGVEARLVEVQVDLSKQGLPGTQTVGLPGAAVRESQERVKIAIRNSGLAGDPMRITINLAPADLPKQGSSLDLAVATAILLADRKRPPRPGWVVVGELALDGTLRPIPGALAMAIAARSAGHEGILLPAANVREAAAIGGIRAVGVLDLCAALAFILGDMEVEAAPAPPFEPAEPEGLGEDLDEVRGQVQARRALEVAAAGGHNLLLIGPPGTGKTMLARRLRTILPPLTVDEAIEITRVASAAGLVGAGGGLERVRPFRAPHHSISPAGLIGGGADLRPGEVSLASDGVLFLDELPEFERRLLDLLRQPIEDGEITLVRNRYRVTLPSRFLLVAGMNPCPCGYHGTGYQGSAQGGNEHPAIEAARSAGRAFRARACRCTPLLIARYMSRISGPLWDRFDLVVEVPPVPFEDLGRMAPPESSATVRKRVEAARATQRARARGNPAVANARIRAKDLPALATLPPDAAEMLRIAARRHGLSARGVHRVLRVARTLADLSGVEDLSRGHIAEALLYRKRMDVSADPALT